MWSVISSPFGSSDLGALGAIQTDVEKPTLTLTLSHRERGCSSLSQRERVGVRVAKITSLFAL